MGGVARVCRARFMWCMWWLGPGMGRSGWGGCSALRNWKLSMVHSVLAHDGHRSQREWSEYIEWDLCGTCSDWEREWGDWAGAGVLPCESKTERGALGFGSGWILITGSIVRVLMVRSMWYTWWLGAGMGKSGRGGCSALWNWKLSAPHSVLVCDGHWSQGAWWEYIVWGWCGVCGGWEWWWGDQLRAVVPPHKTKTNCGTLSFGSGCANPGAQCVDGVCG